MKKRKNYWYLYLILFVIATIYVIYPKALMAFFLLVSIFIIISIKFYLEDKEDEDKRVNNQENIK